jgi:hypothetical protein
MINRLKPYGVMIFVLWPLLTVLFAHSFSEQSLNAQEKIRVEAKISAPVWKVTESRTKRGGTSYWAYYKIPSGNGQIEGGGPISQDTYEAVTRGTLAAIDVYVAQDGTSWTAYGREIHADDSYGKSWFIGAIVGFCCAPLLYFFVVAPIPFGKTRRSLNQRWASDA